MNPGTLAITRNGEFDPYVTAPVRGTRDSAAIARFESEMSAQPDLGFLVPKNSTLVEYALANLVGNGSAQFDLRYKSREGEVYDIYGCSLVRLTDDPDMPTYIRTGGVDDCLAFEVVFDHFIMAQNILHLKHPLVRQGKARRMMPMSYEAIADVIAFLLRGAKYHIDESVPEDLTLELVHCEPTENIAYFTASSGTWDEGDKRPVRLTFELLNHDVPKVADVRAPALEQDGSALPTEGSTAPHYRVSMEDVGQ